MNTFVSLTNVSGQLQLEQTTFETPPTCSVAPTLDTDLVNKAYVDSKSGSITISKIPLSEEAGLNPTTGNLNITLAKNTFNYCLNNITNNDYISPFNMNIGVGNTVNAIAVDSVRNVLYVGGKFITAGGISANGIAKWDMTTSTWSALDVGLNGDCYCLAMDSVNNILYVGGLFTLAGGATATNIAMWMGTFWQSFRTTSGSVQGTGMPYPCNCMAFDRVENALYVGGSFTSSDASFPYSRIAKLTIQSLPSASTWSALGSGLNNQCNVLTVDSVNRILYAGGIFTNVGDQIAKWNISTPAWSTLGTGLNGQCTALVLDRVNKLLYVGGSFTAAGPISANRIATFNAETSIWSPLGSGTSLTVRAIALNNAGNNTVVYAGGNFVTAGGVSAIRIAKWNGLSWSALSSGLNNIPYALEFDATNNILYAGGTFNIAGGVNANYIAYYAKTVNLSVNNKFMYSMKQNDVINVNVTDSTEPYTNGLSI